MPAVVASSSTPVTAAVSGAMPMNVPAPEPGSRTVPPVKPSRVSADQTVRTVAGSV